MTVFLKLCHGRFDPDEDMTAQGFDGPTFAAEEVEGVYNSWITIWNGDEQQFFRFYEDMVFYDGVYYGKYTINANHNGELTVYDEEKALAFYLKETGE